MLIGVKGRRCKPLVRLGSYKPTPFRWWVVDKTMLTDIIEFTKFHLKNEMLEKAKNGFSEGEIKLGEKAMDITVYSYIIFKKLSEYYAEQGVKVQFGMLLSDPIYFNWDPKKEEN